MSVHVTAYHVIKTKTIFTVYGKHQKEHCSTYTNVDLESASYGNYTLKGFQKLNLHN